MITIDGWITIGTKLSTDKFDKQIKELENRIDSEEKKQELLNNKTKEYEAALADATREVNNLSKEYDNATAKAEQLNSTMRNAPKGSFEKMQLSSEYDEQARKVDQLFASLSKAGKAQTNLQNKVAQTKLQYENSTKAVDRLRGKVDSINMKRHQSQIKDFSRNMRDAEKGAKSVKDIISNSISKIGKMAMAVLGVRSAYMALRRASSTLAQYNEQYAKNLEYIQFAIAQGLAPVLQWVVNLTQTLLGYVNALFQTLFGINLFANASAKNFEKMSKSAGGISKSTKEIKNNLASFDEINVLSSNKDTSGGGTSGGIAPSIDLANIEDIKIGNLYNKFEELGRNIANKLNDVIKKINFKKIGTTLGKGLNTIIDFAYGFVTTFDWAEYGKSMSDIINGFFQKVDFAKMAKTLSAGIGGVLNSVASFIENTDWKLIADKFWQFFSNIDWGKIVQGMARALGSALGAFSSFVIQFLIVNPAEDLAQYFYEKMEECGGDAWEGFCKGIVDALYSLGEFIVTKVWEPFINAFKNAFGIHSPSTKMAEMGEFIVQGLFDGISGLIHIITQPFEDIITKIQDTIEGIITYIQNDFTTDWEKSWNKVKDFFGGIWDGIVEVVKGAINLVIDFINGMIAGIENALNWIVDKINSLEITNPFTGEEIWSPHVARVSFGRIPKLAMGGIVAKPTQAIIGEAGREAVMPLDSNTEWMDILADKLSERTNNGGQEIVVRFEGTMAQFVRQLKPQIEVENRRAGTRLITGGAY